MHDVRSTILTLLDAGTSGLLLWSTSGTGEAFDEEARRDYKRRLADLGARISEAESNNDAGTLKTLQTEKYEILSQLQRDSGKNGRAMQNAAPSTSPIVAGPLRGPFPRLSPSSPFDLASRQFSPPEVSLKERLNAPAIVG